MKTRRIPMITKQWLVAVLVLALVPCLGTAQAATRIIVEMSDQDALILELFEARRMR